MAVCPSCSSSRLRNGYRTAPLPLRLLGIRMLLCDACNYEFRAFAPVAPKRHQARRAQSKANIFNTAPEVNLQAIGQPGMTARPAPAAVNFNRAALPVHPTGAAGVSVIEVNDEGVEPPAPPPLRERISEAPTPLTIEEPLMRLKEDLEERRKQTSGHSCPHCGEREVSRRHRKNWERIIFGFTQVRPYFCENCGHRFYAQRHKQRRKRGVLSQKQAEFVQSSCFNQEREGQEGEGDNG